MPEPSPSFALVLGGGNALGAYQAGVYQALEERGLDPGLIAGASIGAINGAIILGNAPADRLRKLREFWTRAEQLPKLDPASSVAPGCQPRELRTAAALQTLAAGRPGLFVPSWPWSWGWPWPDSFTGCTTLGLFDTSPLLATLGDVIDFSRLNDGNTRLIVAAVDVESGEDVTFDSAETTITPEHLRASAAFPPAYPPVEIGGRMLVDGGLSRNLPLTPVLSPAPRADLLCLAVDLVSPTGQRPRSLGDMARRALELAFANQARHAIGGLQAAYRLEGQLEVPRSSSGTVRLLHLAYAGQGEESALKMFDYSAESVRERWSAGFRDAHAGLDLLSSAEMAGRGDSFDAFRYDGSSLTRYR